LLRIAGRILEEASGFHPGASSAHGDALVMLSVQLDPFDPERHDGCQIPRDLAAYPLVPRVFRRI